MFRKFHTFDPASSIEAATTANRRMSHLELVEDGTYADWEAAYLDNVDRIYRLMRSGVGNRPEAGDLTAQVFKAGLGPFRRDSSRDEVRAHLLATARTVLTSHWRRRIGQPFTFTYRDTDVAALGKGSGPDDGEADRKDGPISSGLRPLQSMSVRDAAQVMGTSGGNGKLIQYRALFIAANLPEDDE